MNNNNTITAMADKKSILIAEDNAAITNYSKRYYLRATICCTHGMEKKP